MYYQVLPPRRHLAARLARLQRRRARRRHAAHHGRRLPVGHQGVRGRRAARQRLLRLRPPRSLLLRVLARLVPRRAAIHTCMHACMRTYIHDLHTVIGSEAWACMRMRSIHVYTRGGGVRYARRHRANDTARHLCPQPPAPASDSLAPQPRAPMVGRHGQLP